VPGFRFRCAKPVFTKPHWHNGSPACPSSWESQFTGSTMPHCWVHHGPVCFVCGSIFEFQNFQNPLIFPCSHASDQHGQSSEAARKLSLGVAWGMINSRNYGNQLRIIFPFNIELDKMNDFGSCDCKNPSTALKYHETPSFASDRYVTLLVVLWSKMPCSMHPFLWHLIGFAPRVQPGRMDPCLRHILHIHNHCMPHLRNAQPPRTNYTRMDPR